MLNKILIYNSGGGLGDSIQLFPLILSLKNHFKESKIYYLGAHENHFLNKLKSYNIEIDTLDLQLNYFGFRWWHFFKVKRNFSKLDIKKFDLIIDLQSKLRNTLILKQIPTNIFYSSTFNFFFCSKKLNYISNGKIAEVSKNNIELILNTKFSYEDDAYDKIDDIYVQEARKLLPNKNYIAISITQGNLYRKKSWPLNKVIDLSKNLLNKKKMPVFLINKNEKILKEKISKAIPEALFPEHETKLNSPALVTCLGKRVDCAITIDNGVMHMLSVGKIPIIVLFGPTDAKKFAPSHEVTTILDSKEMYNTDDISSISVEDVLKALEQNLNFSY